MKLMAVYRLLHWQISSKGDGNDNRATPFVSEKLAHKVEGTMIPSDRKKQTRNHLDCGSVFLLSGQQERIFLRRTLWKQPPWATWRQSPLRAAPTE